MILKSFYTNVGMGIKVPFAAIGGVPPYTYSVEPGGVGGTIDVNGVYTSPYAIGKDTIKVVDSDLVPVEATAVIYTGTAIQLVAYIIRTYMGLAEDQVYLFNQKIKPPTDSRIYIAISQLTSKSFGSKSQMDPASGLDEIMSVNMHANLDITIYSRSIDALLRKEQIVAALGSTLSRQTQEQNSFYIAKLSPNIVPLNTVDGAAIPYMFNVSTAIQYVSSFKKGVSYYDTFDFDNVLTNP